MWSLYLVVCAALARPLCISAENDSNYKRVYPYFKMVEDEIATNSESLYLLRQAFLPAVTQQPWLIDDVYILRITADVDFHCEHCASDKNTAVSLKQSWKFRWTDSTVLSLISFDELLAFDPVLTAFLYNSIIHSQYRQSLTLPIQLKDNSTTALNASEIEETLMKAVTLLFSWGKAYARSNGVPTLWDEKDQGYIGVWYNYYAIGSPFTIQQNYQDTFRGIHLMLLLVFIFLNLLLPITILSQANNWNKTLKELCAASVATTKLFWPAGATLTVFNITVIAIMIQQHIDGQPTALRCFLNSKECEIPTSEYKSTFTIEALISKAVVFPVAALIELLAAVIVTRQLNIPAPPIFIARVFRCCKMVGCSKIFVFWQVFLFVQLVVGVMGIPLSIIFIVIPAKTTSFLITLVAFFLFLTVLFRGIFGIRWNSNACNLESVLKSSISFLRTLLLMLTLTALIIEYILFTESGLSLNGVKGVTLSLLPTILISLMVWALKRNLTKSTSQNETAEYHNEGDAEMELLLETV